jgi:hypothetical protein
MLIPYFEIAVSDVWHITVVWIFDVGATSLKNVNKYFKFIVQVILI